MKIKFLYDVYVILVKRETRYGTTKIRSRELVLVKKDVELKVVDIDQENKIILIYTDNLFNGERSMFVNVPNDCYMIKKEKI